MSGRRLIEEELPLKEVNAESARESRCGTAISPRCTFGGRGGRLAMSRAVIFGTLLPDPRDEAKRKEILDLIARAAPLKPAPAGAIEPLRDFLRMPTRTARPRCSIASLEAARSRSKRYASAVIDGGRSQPGRAPDREVRP